MTVSPLSSPVNQKADQQSTNRRVRYFNPFQTEENKNRRKLKSGGVVLRKSLNQISDQRIAEKPKLPFKFAKRNSTALPESNSSWVDKEAEKLNHAMNLEELGHEEYNRMLQIFKEIDFAHGKAIHMLFGYKLLNIKQEEGKIIHFYFIL